jgi:probable transposase/helix-turn-helix protein
MRKTYKYCIYLQGGQRRILNTMLEECRWVYNQTLEAREFAYQNSITCGLFDTQAMLPERYVSFSVEVEPKRLPPSAEIVGVDVGLASFATLSNGEQIDNPRFYREDEADLKRAQKLKDAAKNAQKWDENRHRKKALAHIHESKIFCRKRFTPNHTVSQRQRQSAPHEADSWTTGYQDAVSALVSSGSSDST